MVVSGLLKHTRTTPLPIPMKRLTGPLKLSIQPGTGSLIVGMTIEENREHRTSYENCPDSHLHTHTHIHSHCQVLACFCSSLFLLNSVFFVVAVCHHATKCIGEILYFHGCTNKDECLLVYCTL
jgi:hypothetical protein